MLYSTSLKQRLHEGELLFATFVKTTSYQTVEVLAATGLDALVQLNKTLKRIGARLVLCDVNEQPRGLMARSGFDVELGEASFFADLSAALAGLASGVASEPAKTPVPDASV